MGLVSVHAMAAYNLYIFIVMSMYSFFFFVALRPNVGHDLLILEVFTNNDAPQLVGLLWTSDQLVAEIST